MGQTRRLGELGQSYLSQLSRQPGGKVSACNGLAIHLSYHRGSPKPKIGPDPEASLSDGNTAQAVVTDPAKPPVPHSVP